MTEEEQEVKEKEDDVHITLKRPVADKLFKFKFRKTYSEAVDQLLNFWEAKHNTTESEIIGRQVDLTNREERLKKGRGKSKNKKD